MAAHSYWRVLINSLTAGDSVFIIEAEFRATLGGADQCSGGTAISDGSYANLSRIFDDDYNEYSYSTSTAATGSWFGYQFASAVSVAQVRLKISSDFDNAPGKPSSLSFQSSDNGIDWTNEATSTPITWSAVESYAYDNLFAAALPETVTETALTISVNSGFAIVYSPADLTAATTISFSSAFSPVFNPGDFSTTTGTTINCSVVFTGLYARNIFAAELGADIEIKTGLQMIGANLAVTDFSVENIAANIDVVRFETQSLQADVIVEPVAAGFVIDVAKGERL